ncbi:NEDD4-binding protein 1-like isoform X2 [Microplitis mediator]|uniref:NEDD4-binding protein 1-like isoform X2 n=1 Tax=Microplitis mediator TaxID=375433 RepID=UPI002554627C|nr:NEDD4-binding protein 1-like isoform X2 [Microplitis mediator]
MKRRKLSVRTSGRRKSYKMNSLDDSVILCDVSSKINKKASINLKDSSRRQSISSMRTRSNLNNRKPLHPVHKSPLSRNTCLKKSPLSIIKKKRLEEIEILPIKKRQKASLSETIVISDDDDDDNDKNKVIGRRFKKNPEVIVVDNCSSSKINNKRLKSCDDNKSNAEIKRKKRMEEKILERKNMRRMENLKRTQNRARKKAGDSKKNNDEDEIAVIWSSENGDNTRVDKKNEETISPDNTEKKTEALFFVDTIGDDRNLKKISLLPPLKVLYTTNSFSKFETVPTTATTTITSEKVNNNNNNNDNNEATDDTCNKTRKLREIIVDGLNVAFGYSLGKRLFQKNGLQLILDYFQDRGHTIKIFLPQNQRNRNREFLEQWYREGLVVFTPSRNVGGKKIVPYDDRFIVEYATKCKGIIISSDQYRDLWKEKPEWRETIENRLLAPTFVGEYVMFPDDPLGRGGPSLYEFLRH